jgi:organic hydroperoxide reductase OsmC/OhrA
MLKIRVAKARVHVAMRNKQEGSVLQGTVKAGCLGFETRLELESEEPAERIAQLVRVAENGCFSMQAVLGQTTVTTSTTLNGEPLAT